MQQGDIILVPFPFTDLTSYKTRPALVLSGKKQEDVIVAAITSQYYEDTVKIDTVDLEYGQLPVTSFIRYDKIVTLHSSLVRKIVARINIKTMEKVREKFLQLF